MFIPAPWLFALLLTPLGACVGSFLNVVIYRLPREMSLSNPPSHCPHCGVPIKIYDNIPVFGWLLLRGRGRCCGQKISWRYPAVELLTALLWGAVGWYGAGFTGSVWLSAGLITAWVVFISVLIAISFIDFDLQIIPDELSLGGTVAALLASVFLPQLHVDFVRHFPAVSPHLSALFGALCGAAVGAAVLYAITIIGTLAMRETIKKIQEYDPEVETAFGFGDVKLMALVGAFLGWKGALAALLLGTVGGAFFGLIEKIRTGRSQEGAVGFDALLQRWRSGVSLIPFGPFICIGALLVLFFRAEIFCWLGEYFSPVVKMFGL